jgi:two-component system sensor histidine kinase VicK
MSHSARDLTTIHREIDDFRRRISVLQEQADRDVGAQSTAVSALVEELHVAVAELLTNEEELRLKQKQWGEVQERLRKERLRYEDLFEHAPDPYLVTSAVGVIQQVNVPAAAFLQKSKESLIGKPLLVFVADMDKRVYLDRLAYLATPDGRLVRNWVLRFCRQAEPLSGSVNVAAQRDSRQGVVMLRWSIRETSFPS